MKPSKLFVALVVILSALVFAAYVRGQSGSTYSVTVRWDANTEPDVSGYRLRWSDSGTSGWVRDCRLVTTQTVSLPHRGPWTFLVLAYNTAGMESLPSSNLVVAFPGTPGGLRAVAGAITTTTNWVLVP